VSATDVSNVAAIACTDGASAIAVGGVSGFGTTAAQGSVMVSGNGTHSLVCTATDGVGNSGAAAGSVNTGIVKIDVVPPTTTITAPANNAVYILNASVNAQLCVRGSGAGIRACSPVSVPWRPA
jgi:hypothetical protein